jgi:hypothetical protein
VTLRVKPSSSRKAAPAAFARHIPPHPRNLTVPAFVNLSAGGGDPPSQSPLTPSPDNHKRGRVNGFGSTTTEPVTPFVVARWNRNSHG